MSEKNFDRRLAEQNAVRNLESSVDREARRSSQGSLWRLVFEIVLMIVLTAISPFYLFYAFWKEMAADSKQGELGLERPEGSREETAERQISSQNAPLLVSPLADFSRSGVDIVTDAEARFVLISPVIYEIEDTHPVGESNDENFRSLILPEQEHLRQVPVGFLSDFASIPWFFGWLIRPTGRYGRAAVVHDWAYSYHNDGSRQGRKDCDVAMLRLMRRDRVHPSLRALIYVGLRVGGGWAFHWAPGRREALRPISEAMVFPILSVQSYLLGFMLRQMEDPGFLRTLEDKAKRTEVSQGAWYKDIPQAIQEQQRTYFGKELF